VGLRPTVKADLALLGVSGIWGTTFIVVKGALDDASPLAFLSVRFALGTLILGWIFRKNILPVKPAEVYAGALLGFFLGVGFAFQTMGLVHIPASRSAFITGLYIVGVPILAAVLKLRGLNKYSIAGVAIALAGLFMITGAGSDGSGLNRGELLTLLCAACFAAHIVSVDIFTRRYDARSLSFWQVAVATLIALPMTALGETIRFQITPSLIAAILVTGIGATALAVAVQNTVQAWTTPTRTAIIFTTEPVFAAVASFFFAGERLSAGAAAGAGLILTGMLVSEIPSGRSREQLST
jgi:drug/metabolite transporter (DMT)-like permease